MWYNRTCNESAFRMVGTDSSNDDQLYMDQHRGNVAIIRGFRDMGGFNMERVNTDVGIFGIFFGLGGFVLECAHADT